MIDPAAPPARYQTPFGLRAAIRANWLPGLLAGAVAWLALEFGGTRSYGRTWPYMLLALAAYLVLRDGNAAQRAPLGRTLGRWIWAPAAAAALATLWSAHRSLSYDAALLWAAFALTAWLAGAAGRADAPRLTGWLMAALAVPPLVSLPRLLLTTIVPRTMTYDYKNAAGITMVVLILLCWAWQVHIWQSGPSRGTLRRWWPAALGLLGSLFLWYSFSRASLYLAIPGFLVALWLMPARWRLRGLVLGAFLVLAGNPLMRGAEAVKSVWGGVWSVREAPAGAEMFDPGHMLFQTGDYSFVTRLEMWSTAWRAFLDRPWGWGPGTYGDVFLAYQAPGSQIFSNSAHSLVFSSLFEAGPFLLLALFGIALAWFFTVWGAWPAVPENEKPLLGGAMAAMAVLAVHAVLDLTWEIPAVLLTAGTLGGLLAARLRVLSAATSAAPGAAAPAGRPSQALPLLVGLAVLVLVIRPYYSRTLVTWGLAQMIAEQVPRAIPTLRQAAALDPLAAQPHAWLADAYLRQWRATHMPEDLDQAEAAALRAVARAPRVPALHRQAAQVRLAAGDMEGFRSRLNQALAYAPRDLIARIELAQSDLRTGRAAEARERLEQVVADSPILHHNYTPQTMAEWWPRVRVTLALAYLAEQRQEQAAEQIAILLQEYPDNDEVRQLAEQIPVP